ncbi:uncharacterized protein LOC131245918 [Magnolia sinica]|uniref:uncharacterized protein LOC131245918 n=1 Tax=Magnolia sinica TaxID=86752 RepID=UPI00265B0583|nr:uncharacterized protein LOC131245918 [Magnolia sinica]
MATQQAVEAIPPRTEQSNHSVSQPVQLVVQLQPPQLENPLICHNQPIRHSVVESECELSRCSSSLQTDVATQQPVVGIPPRTKQSNHSVSQPFQLVVQLQPPQSEDHSICHNQPIRHSVVESEHELSRCSSSQQTDMAMQQAVEAIPPQTAQSNHSVSQHVPPPSMSMLMGIPPVAYPESTGTSPSLTIHLPQTYPVASRQTSVLRPNPLQNELAKLRKEQEHVIKTHEDEKTRLISEREREIEEVCRKYGGLIQNSETACLRQQKALETWISKVNLNLMLAEALKLKFADATNPGCTPPRQGTPTVRQQFPILPLPQTAQRPPRALGPPVQVVHHPTDLFSANPAAPRFRPPMPPTINLSIGTELRAPAPHLQYFRSTSILSPNHFPQPSGIPSQPSPSVLTTTSPLPLPLRSLPSHPLGTFSGTCLPNSSIAFPAFHNPSLSAVEPRVDFNIHSGMNLPNQLRMAEAGSGVGSLVPPITTTPGGNGMGKAIHSATEVVCLLDDD